MYPWPAESAPVDQPAARDPRLRFEMSGAHLMNPDTLLVTRPGVTYQLERQYADGNDTHQWAVARQWPIGDEDVTTLSKPGSCDRLVAVLLENSARIRAFDHATGEVWHTWELPEAKKLISGKAGPEGLTFMHIGCEDVANLACELSGNPSIAQALHGVFLVAHQNGGVLLAYGLATTNLSLVYLGAISTARRESSSLHWDADARRLYIGHNVDGNVLEVCSLDLNPVTTLTGQVTRLRTIVEYRLPGGNVEGFTASRMVAVVTTDYENNDPVSSLPRAIRIYERFLG